MEILIHWDGALYRIDGKREEDGTLWLEEVGLVPHKEQGLVQVYRENYREVSPDDLQRLLTEAMEHETGV